MKLRQGQISKTVDKFIEGIKFLLTYDTKFYDMKLTNFKALLAASVIILFSFSTQKATKSQDGLGNIKYSILPPEKFRAENGSGWVLLDNGEDLSSLGFDIMDTDLCLTHKYCSMIDVRGYFIRSHDNRKENRVDVDRKWNTPIGSPQNDTFKKHKHKTTKPVFGHRNSDFPTQEDMDPGGWGGYMPVETDFKGGNETRPKNLNLYTYIKVNK